MGRSAELAVKPSIFRPDENTFSAGRSLLGHVQMSGCGPSCGRQGRAGSGSGMQLMPSTLRSARLPAAPRRREALAAQRISRASRPRPDPGAPGWARRKP